MQLNNQFTYVSLCTPIAAGVCWEKKGNGKCKRPVQRSISKAECCAAGPDAGFTEKDMSDYEYFFATSLGENSECMSCIGLIFSITFLVSYCNCGFLYTESCATAKCGKSKRCVMRNGQPKCVCSPKCGSTFDEAHKYQRRNRQMNRLLNQTDVLLSTLSDRPPHGRHKNRRKTNSSPEKSVSYRILDNNKLKCMLN